MDRKKVAEILGREIPDGWWIRYCNAIKFVSDFPDKLPSKAQSLNQIEALHKSLVKVSTILDNLSLHEIGAIALAEGEPAKNLGQYDEAVKAIRWLQEQATKALKRIVDCYPKTKSGPKTNMRLRVLIANLAALWEELTGKKPKFTYNPYEEIYTGRFLEFVKISCQWANLTPPSTPAITKLIQRNI